jgi:hypothetical protein
MDKKEEKDPLLHLDVDGFTPPEADTHPSLTAQMLAGVLQRNGAAMDPATKAHFAMRAIAARQHANAQTETNNGQDTVIREASHTLSENAPALHEVDRAAIAEHETAARHAEAVDRSRSNGSSQRGK